MGAPLESLLRRDRMIVAASLAIVTLMAWAYVLSLVRAMTAGDTDGMDMSAMDMKGMDMPGMADAMLAPAPRPWSVDDFAFVFAMWSVMMVGMMIPSAAPMILLYARVGRQSAMQGKPLAATGFFASGYLIAWTLFSAAATLGQWLLERAVLLTPMIASASAVFSGIVLLAAGLYQWTPLKYACLTKCRAPVMFIYSHGGFKRDPLGSLTIGLRHGLYCVGCCWALMALLFVGGVMNVLWIAAIAVFVLAEKLLPGGRRLSQLAGGVLCGTGVWLIGAAVI